MMDETELNVPQPTPTDKMPGPEKVDVLAQRYADGQALFCDEDAGMPLPRRPPRPSRRGWVYSVLKGED